MRCGCTFLSFHRIALYPLLHPRVSQHNASVATGDDDDYGFISREQWNVALQSVLDKESHEKQLITDKPRTERASVIENGSLQICMRPVHSELATLLCACRCRVLYVRYPPILCVMTGFIWGRKFPFLIIGVIQCLQKTALKRKRKISRIYFETIKTLLQLFDVFFHRACNLAHGHLKFL